MLVSSASSLQAHLPHPLSGRAYEGSLRKCQLQLAAEVCQTAAVACHLEFHLV